MKIQLSVTCLFSMVAAIVLIASPVQAQDAAVDTVLEGLHNPSGVAVQPETGHVFVADSGALRVIRVVDGKAQDVITDFPKDVYGKGPKYNVGPLGLLFLDKDTLVVGGGGKPDGEEMLRVYKVPAAGEDAIKADALHGEAKMLAPTDEVKGEGNFYALAKGNSGIYVTCNGDDTKGWVSMATVDAENKLKDFTRTIATKEAVEVDAPVAITMSPEGHVVVGQMGEINVAGDSLLTFYDEKGKMLDNFELGLHDVTGLAYGPKAGRLFATDFNWLDTANGGVYKIVKTDDDKGCEAKTIAILKKPTALAFDDKGNLYITLAGDNSEDTEEPDGKLVMLKEIDKKPEAKK